MCLWAIAPFLSCLRSLMDIDWNRSLKWNCLLLLTSLPVIQRLIYGVQQHIQGKQQQVKRLKGLSFWWRLFALIMILSFFFFFNQILWFNTQMVCFCQNKQKCQRYYYWGKKNQEMLIWGDVCTLQYLSSLVSCSPSCLVKKLWHGFGLFQVSRQDLDTAQREST